MAPEIAREAIVALEPACRVLDPMSGSGVVLRLAAERGNEAIGIDVDPLAVLMASVWTTPLDVMRFLHDAHFVLSQAKQTERDGSEPYWHDDATRRYVDYWFAPLQRAQLCSLTAAIAKSDVVTADALRVAMSRIIITKDRGASLARDVSHSRPHKSWLDNDYDVYDGFLRSCRLLAQRLEPHLLRTKAMVRRGDCRKLDGIETGSVEAIVTSPPYLNAIDYLRGHRLALVWLGFNIEEIKRIRSSSIGSERAGAGEFDINRYIAADEGAGLLPAVQLGWIHRYYADAQAMMREFSRVCRPGGTVVLVVGDSYLRGCRVANAAIFEDLMTLFGIETVRRIQREIPAGRRYLPPPAGASALSARMRTEVVLTGAKR